VSIVVATLLVGGFIAAAPAFAAAPTITSFTPTTAKLLTPISITGTGFSSPATVRFGGVAATAVTINSATSIAATLPSAAPSGYITVTTGGGTATSATVLTVAPGVALSPVVGPPSTVVTVTFSGFSAYEAVDVYLDTTDVALISASGNGTASTTLTIPAATTPGAHWISVVGRHSGYSAQKSFLVRTDSPMYGYTATHRANYSRENVLNPAAVSGGLSESWHTASSGSTVSTPAIVGGVVYEAFFSDGVVGAYNEATGAQKWVASYGDEPYGSPAVVAGVLYIGFVNGDIYALNAANGSVKWKYTAGNAISSSPTVSGGVVYVGSNDDNLYALNAATGALLWKYSTGGAVTSSPAVSGGLVYFGSYDQKVYALNATTGALVWTFSTGSNVPGSPSVADGLVFIGSADHEVYAINAKTGTERWGVNTGIGNSNGIAVAGGYVYFGTGNDTVYAVGESSGSVAWTKSMPSPIDSGTTYADGVLFVSDQYNVYALSSTNGAVLTTLPTETPGYAVVVDGTVTIGESSSGSVVHYTLDAGGADSAHARPSIATLRPTIRT
jgi:outer membrane protein assembly factor BamB